MLAGLLLEKTCFRIFSVFKIFYPPPNYSNTPINNIWKKLKPPYYFPYFHISCKMKASFKLITIATELINNFSNVTAPNLTHFPHSNLYSITEEILELKQIHELLQSMTKTYLNITTMKMSMGD